MITCWYCPVCRGAFGDTPPAAGANHYDRRPGCSRYWCQNTALEQVPLALPDAPLPAILEVVGLDAWPAMSRGLDRDGYFNANGRHPVDPWQEAAIAGDPTILPVFVVRPRGGGD